MGWQMSFVSKEIVAGDDLLTGIGLMLGHFTVTATYGTSRCGFVYDAVDKNGHQVRIKECFPEAYCKRIGSRVSPSSQRYISDFRDEQKKLNQEARILARLDHTSIVGVRNIFEENGTTYVVFERTEAKSLRDVIAEGRLTHDQLTEITQDLLGAIEYMHDQGVLHGSITPDTILLTDDLKPILTGFDAARELVTDGLPSFTMPKVSDGFSPQEFYVAGGQTGTHSDLYMLAASLYFAFTGVTPPSAQSRLTALSRQKSDPYSPLLRSEASPSKGYAAALDTAMQANPRKRMATADQWLKMIAPKRLSADPISHPFAHSHSPKGTGIYRSPDH